MQRARKKHFLFSEAGFAASGSLSGIILPLATLGKKAERGAEKVTEKSLPVPPGLLVDNVRDKLEIASDESFISRIRPVQVQNPPVNASAVPDNATALMQPGPLCVDSTSPTDLISPSAGSLLICHRVQSAGQAGELSDCTSWFSRRGHLTCR